ncbi:MAG TPA: D-arabinono-1,4-lactone oxidase [Opitutaceae bacterium]
MKPFVDDVESFELLGADGRPVRCSRGENAGLFSLVIGGYGLFGVITEVTLRLAPRSKLRRTVEIADLKDLPERVGQRISEGFLYGDFQFKTDEKTADFLESGVFSCYRPVPADTPIPKEQASISPQLWSRLYQLAHMDKSAGFREYSDYYLSTDGQIYWSDTHQMSFYVSGQDALVDQARGSRSPGSLMICEFYVPRHDLPEFMSRLGRTLRREEADLIYGTIRFIERDNETFLPWARERCACIVINLRVLHDAEGIAAATRQFQAAIDEALDLGGSYFLTYHRWATKEQVLKAYPQFPEFLKRKLRFDPQERFQSEWYRHYKAMFKGELESN